MAISQSRLWKRFGRRPSQTLRLASFRHDRITQKRTTAYGETQGTDGPYRSREIRARIAPHGTAASLGGAPRRRAADALRARVSVEPVPVAGEPGPARQDLPAGGRRALGARALPGRRIARRLFVGRYLRQFEAIRERLAVERWYLCGQSLGASLTLRYSLAFPERVIAQVITNSNSAFATAEIIVERRRLATAAIADLEARGLAAVEDLPVHPRRAPTTARRSPPGDGRRHATHRSARDRRLVPASQRRCIGA